jgi:hypothetical protein
VVFMVLLLLGPARETKSRSQNLNGGVVRTTSELDNMKICCVQHSIAGTSRHKTASA